MNRSGRKQFILPMVLIITAMAAGGGIFFYVNQVMDTGPTLTDVHIDSDAALKLNLMKQVSKKNGITEWELEASTATLIRGQDQAVLTDIRVVFYTRDNTRIFLTSNGGSLNTKTHDMNFEGNVLVQHQTYILKTDKLHYKKKSHIIYTDSGVLIESTASVMEADTLEARLKENKLILQGDVKGKFSENVSLL